MRKSLIAAFDKNFLVGAEGKLPWSLPEDMKLFRRLTMDKPIIMGRKTFESLGRPLPRRTNIVLSTRPDFAAKGCNVVRSLAEAFKAAAATGAAECMVIGGANVYEQALWAVDRAYLTVIRHAFDVKRKRDQVYFPRVDWWEARHARAVRQEEYLPGPNNPYGWTFLVLDFDPAKTVNPPNAADAPSASSVPPRRTSDRSSVPA